MQTCASGVYFSLVLELLFHYCQDKIWQSTLFKWLINVHCGFYSIALCIYVASVLSCSVSFWAFVCGIGYHYLFVMVNKIWHFAHQSNMFICLYSISKSVSEPKKIINSMSNTKYRTNYFTSITDSRVWLKRLLVGVQNRHAFYLIIYSLLDIIWFTIVREKAMNHKDI